MKPDKIEISEAFNSHSSRKYRHYYKDVIEIDRCPFRDKQICRVKKDIKCNFGLSENQVPEQCPLKKGEMLLTVSLNKL